MTEDTNIESTIRFFGEIYLNLIPQNGNHPHNCIGNIVKRIDYHEDGSESEFLYIEIDELSHEVICGRAGFE